MEIYYYTIFNGKGNFKNENQTNVSIHVLSAPHLGGIVPRAMKRVTFFSKSPTHFDMFHWPHSKRKKHTPSSSIQCVARGAIQLGRWSDCNLARVNWAEGSEWPAPPRHAGFLLIQRKCYGVSQAEVVTITQTHPVVVTLNGVTFFGAKQNQLGCLDRGF